MQLDCDEEDIVPWDWTVDMARSVKGWILSQAERIGDRVWGSSSSSDDGCAADGDGDGDDGGDDGNEVMKRRRK